MMTITEFKAWVYIDFKLDLSAYKENQLDRRINSLLSRLGFTSFDEYIKVLKIDKDQRKKFLDFITINVTEFVRNPEFFEELEKEISKDLSKSTGKYRIWSAACSIGCEPYTLGIIMDRLNAYNRTNILATDIDETILSRAKIGVYTVNEIKNVKNEDLSSYFLKKDDKYHVNDKMKNIVEFKKHDLILDEFSSSFDLIVCRNVVIYFNQDVKDNIYKKFYQALKPGGMLFVGATESIYNYKSFGFEKASTFIYRKL